jgi:G2/mitotic-specific cyclin-B, other
MSTIRPFMRRIAENEVVGTKELRIAFSDLSNSSVKEPSSQPVSVVPLGRASTKVWYEGLPDYDRQDVDDPKFVCEYAASIFSKLWRQPGLTVGYYMASKQSELTDEMRTVLVDWMVEVHWKFKLYPETLFLCVNLLDRFLNACPNIARNQLQLVGATCLLLAAKYEDVFAPEIKEVVQICDKTYKKEEVLAMEVKVLNVLNFEVTQPSSLLFLLRLVKIHNCEERQFYLAQYCLELAMTNCALWTSYHPAQMASGALYLTNKLFKSIPGWPNLLSEITGYSEASLKPIAKELCNLLQLANEARTGAPTKAINKKFTQAKFLAVARLIL